MDTYEKKYKNALEWARQVMNGKTGFIRKEVEEVFSELKESEDEKIRKKAIEYIEAFVPYDDKDDIITWLKKQGKQKSTNKVKPKFKVGDWIISDETHEDYRICKITNVENGNYTIESIYGYKGYNTFETFEKSYHLWTIQDAKPGDILAEDTIVLIVDHLGTFENKLIIYSWYFADYNKFYGMGPSEPDRWEVEGFHPATKEQRNLLFSKMKEAGYEWDAEKKELKKIEQNIVACSEEDEDRIDIILERIEQLKNEVHSLPRSKLIKIEEKPIGKTASEVASEIGKETKNEDITSMEHRHKFSIGDWVDYVGRIMEIKGLGNSFYDCVDTNGKDFYVHYSDESMVRLWAIQNAKNGEILKEDTCTFILKELTGDGQAKIYGALFSDGDVCYFGCTLHFDENCTRPATKAERDLLLEKLREEGYRWDEKHLELTKIK